MKIEELPLGDLIELLQGIGTPAAIRRTHSLRVGEKYFIRTVTHYYTGRLVAITDCDITLDDAAWIADTGRFCPAMASGNLDEIEPFPGAVCVNRESIVDFQVWPHDLPREQKCE